ncbi:MAG: sugar transferase [Erysipelotrichaceae bacterium]|nr:sugar transferase [Erysipelotrichaceae bacterium]
MYLVIKRGIDFILSIAALIVLSPLFIVLMIWIKAEEPNAPIFFRQKRIGKDKSIFKIYKFRSMKQEAPSEVATEDLDDPNRYVTKAGVFLRRYSLDELPQLINIIKGDMSIVAPRPALWNQYKLIEERDKYVGRYGLTPNQIRPGLTGWAQINGRDSLNDAEKAVMDGEYIKNISFLFDLKCIFGTVGKVLTHDNVKE